MTIKSNSINMIFPNFYIRSHIISLEYLLNFLTFIQIVPMLQAEKFSSYFCKIIQKNIKLTCD